jgi:hypothetical protein
MESSLVGPPLQNHTEPGCATGLIAKILSFSHDCHDLGGGVDRRRRLAQKPHPWHGRFLRARPVRDIRVFCYLEDRGRSDVEIAGIQPPTLCSVLAEKSDTCPTAIFAAGNLGPKSRNRPVAGRIIISASPASGKKHSAPDKSHLRCISLRAGQKYAQAR